MTTTAKRSTFFALVAATALTLSACGSSTKEVASDSSTTSTSTTAAPNSTQASTTSTSALDAATPEAAMKLLATAINAGDTATASRLATPDAVTALKNAKTQQGGGNLTGPVGDKCTNNRCEIGAGSLIWHVTFQKAGSTWQATTVDFGGDAH